MDGETKKRFHGLKQEWKERENKARKWKGKRKECISKRNERCHELPAARSGGGVGLVIFSQRYWFTSSFN